MRVILNLRDGSERIEPDGIGKGLTVMKSSGQAMNTSLRCSLVLARLTGWCLNGLRV